MDAILLIIGIVYNANNTVVILRFAILTPERLSR
jgi:hypothetical protein